MFEFCYGSELRILGTFFVPSDLHVKCKGLQRLYALNILAFFVFMTLVLALPRHKIRLAPAPGRESVTESRTQFLWTDLFNGISKCAQASLSAIGIFAAAISSGVAGTWGCAPPPISPDLKQNSVSSLLCCVVYNGGNKSSFRYGLARLRTCFSRCDRVS